MNKIVFILLSALLLVTGCAQKKDYVVTIHTAYGNIIAILYDETPKHKQNFIKLAGDQYFDSLLFHRVIQGFMIQGGDPDSKYAQQATPLGNGGPNYTIDAEINPKLFHKKGALAAARVGDDQNPARASNGSQFYIVQGSIFSEDALKIDQEKLRQAFQKAIENPANTALVDTLQLAYQRGGPEGYQKKLFSLTALIEQQSGMKITRDLSEDKITAYTTLGGTPQLDGGYTVFGEVIHGFEVIDSIAKQPTYFEDRPVKDVRMQVTVEEMPRDKITTLYGYHYPVEINKAH